MKMNVVDELFHPERRVHALQIWHSLGRYEIQRLAYAGEIGCNPGYIFRGEAAWDCPLQSSLETKYRTKATRNSSELISKEKTRTSAFLKGRKCERLLKIIEASDGTRPSWDDVWWWLSLMQHYRERTRLIDFTRDIRVALFFAIEHYESNKEKFVNKEFPVIIYCLPCKDLRYERDPDNNKTPVLPKNSKSPTVDMNLVIGHEIKLDWMMRHHDPKCYYDPNRKQQWGWDRPRFENPRLKVQKGMFAYACGECALTDECRSWLVERLSETGKHFNIGGTANKLPGKQILIAQKYVAELKKLLDKSCGISKATLYL